MEFFQHKEVSEVETLMDSSLQWVTGPELTVKKKWENKLTVSVLCVCDFPIFSSALLNQVILYAVSFLRLYVVFCYLGLLMCMECMSGDVCEYVHVGESKSMRVRISVCKGEGKCV